MREILNRTITGTYLMYWHPTLPRDQWTKAFELSDQVVTHEFTWTMGTIEELNEYARYYCMKHGAHDWELTSTQ